MWNLKYDTNEPIYATETDSQTWGTDLWLPGGRRGGSGTDGNLGNTTALISHASKVMLKILQARLQQYVNHEFPDVQADFTSELRLEKHLPWR